MKHKETTFAGKLVLATLFAIAGTSVQAQTFELRMAVESVPGAREIERGDIDAGIDRLHQVLEQSLPVPAGAVATDLCAAYIMQRNLASAERWCDRAVEESPRNGAAHNNRGVLRTLQGAFSAAVEDLREATSLRNYKVGAQSHTEMINQGYRHESRQIAARNLAIAERRWAAVKKEQPRLANK